VVDSIDAAVAAVPGALALDRSNVAAIARRRFSADRMVDAYLSVYHQLLERGIPRSSQPPSSWVFATPTTDPASG
jgi:hypothetical protein